MIIEQTTPIPVANADLTGNEREYLLDAFDSGMISRNGGYVPRFEALLGQQVGRRHVIAANSGTTALLLALMALGVGVGDEVILPALTFVAPAAMVKLLGATPVFADVHENDWTLSAGGAAAKVTHRTKAVIAVNLAGVVCDFLELRAVIPEDIPIIEDAAQSAGASRQGVNAGANGLISIFSFFANKSVVTGEGGAVLTDDDTLAAHIRHIAGHGMREGAYYHDVVGINGRMTNLQAAIGLAQVERWEQIMERRRQIAAWYDKALRVRNNSEWYLRRPVPKDACEALWLYAVTARYPEKVVAALKAKKMDARRMFPLLPTMPPYRDGGCYPVAEKVSRYGLFLPTFNQMNEETVQDIVEALP